MARADEQGVEDGRGAGAGTGPGDDVAADVRAAYAGATWFELARATSLAHRAVEQAGAQEPGSDVRGARYAALRAMLDEATQELSTHCLHARL